MTNFSLRLLDNESSIRQKILAAMQEEITGIIKRAIPKIEDKIKTVVGDALRQEPEYSSLMGGVLKAEFGIPDSSSVERVIDALVNTLKFNLDPIVANRSGLKGGFSLTMMKSDDMDGVVYLDSGSVVDTQRGYILPWLEWLLYENNKPIVKRYAVEYTGSPYSRSGMAIMVPDKSNWRVPPEFAGSTKNNWSTRAISRLDPAIYNIISNTIKDVL